MLEDGERKELWEQQENMLKKQEQQDIESFIVSNKHTTDLDGDVDNEQMDFEKAKERSQRHQLGANKIEVNLLGPEQHVMTTEDVGGVPNSRLQAQQ